MKKYHGKDGKVNMCKGLEDMMAEKLEEGLALGKEEGLALGKEEGLERGIKAFVEACQELQVPKEETIAKLCNKFNTTRERAEETIQNYWK